MHFKARAVLFALIIAGIVSILSGAVVRLSALNAFRWEIVQFESDQQRLERSAWVYLRALEATEPFAAWVDVHENQRDSVYLGTDQWGLMAYSWSNIPGNSNLGVVPISKTGFWNFPSPPQFRQVALYLADQNRLLAMVGNARIAGTAYLPKAGARRGSIHGQHFHGQRFVEGETKISKYQLPSIDLDVKRHLQYLKTKARTLSTSPYQSTIQQSFLDSTYVLRSAEWNLNQVNWSGKIWVVATDSIVVNADANLDQVILMAPSIRFKGGFKGSVQAFASQQLIVETGVQLNYPSILGFLDEDPQEKGQFTIASKAKIQGLIWAEANFISGKKASIHLHESGEVEGWIYTKLPIDLAGTIKGSLFCERLFVKRDGALYDNHLLDGQLLVHQRNQWLDWPLMRAGQGVEKQIMQWTE
ncbi:MAG: hypothetical protein AAF598_07375 [Bacteroidota bacterium]